VKTKMFIIWTIASALILPNTFASNVISSQKAGGYQYSVIKDNNTFTWTVGHQGNLIVIEETKGNQEELERFRYSVEDINSYLFEFIISAVYFLIVLITTLVIFKKNKQTLKGSHLIIIASLAVIALCNSVVTSIDMYTAYQDARYYYSLLVQQF
jgi:hypothetical protein